MQDCPGDRWTMRTERLKSSLCPGVRFGQNRPERGTRMVPSQADRGIKQGIPTLENNTIVPDQSPEQKDA